MAGLLSKNIWLIRKNGIVYFWMRSLYEIKRKSGLLRLWHPVNVFSAYSFSIKEWKQKRGKFFIDFENVKVPKIRNEELSARVQDIFQQKIRFFNGEVIDLSRYRKWIQNPKTGYVYNAKEHWTMIPDFSAERGDIKFIWEPSRFCYFYDIIRYDHHFDELSDAFIFAEIISWIDGNPVNCGPNYVSAQEISLRVINWITALHFYADSPHLTDDIFIKIYNNIYWQVKHVEADIGFSSKFVRNNHLLTESLCLFITGLIFPQLKESEEWKKKGYRVFTREIQYQIASDGSYLQHTFNYHRIALQLITSFIVICRNNDIKVSDENMRRVKTTISFFNTFIQQETGYMPDFGNNDGSLFFPLNNNSFFNYKPQLQALANAAGLKLYDQTFEDTFWFAGDNKLEPEEDIPADGIREFTYEGYYTIRDHETFTFFWCPAFHHRPSQSDNLHLDIWYKDKNILHDSGMYLYNTEDRKLRDYFFGSESHNTLLYDDKGLMEKGGRFIFYFWPEKLETSASETVSAYVLTGKVKAFHENGRYKVVSRRIEKSKTEPLWVITDTVMHDGTKKIKQLWHISDEFLENFLINAHDETGKELSYEKKEVWFAPVYGVKIPSTEIYFATNTQTIKTTIALK